MVWLCDRLTTTQFQLYQCTQTKNQNRFRQQVTSVLLFSVGMVFSTPVVKLVVETCFDPIYLFIPWQLHVLPDCVRVRLRLHFRSFCIGAPGYRTFTLGVLAVRYECGSLVRTLNHYNSAIQYETINCL